MKYSKLKADLMDMFDEKKLHMLPEEWGFFNEFDREINIIGYAVNLTEEIIEKARQQQIEFLVTHHDSWEFIFGLKESCSKMLEESGITHAYFHAPLDDAEFGTSASLGKKLGMGGLEKVMPYAEIYYGGVIGEIEPVDFNVFRERLTDILAEQVRCYQNNENPVRKVAVAAGGGNMTTEMRIAAEAGCDTYVTGEFVLYSQQYAQHVGMNLFVGSHTNTEILGVESLVQKLSGDKEIQIIKIDEPNY